MTAWASPRASESTTPIRAVVLDLDDTPFDHATSMRRGVLRLLAELGLRPTPELARSWEEQAVRLMERHRAGTLGPEGYRRARVAHLLAAAGHPDADGMTHAPDVLDQTYAQYLELYEDSWIAFPDAHATLDRLRAAGLRLGVLTNGPEDRQRRKLRALEIDTRVDALCTSESVGSRKPDPRMYAAICEVLDVAPEQVLHVGDDVENDVRGPIAAGMRAVHLDRSSAASSDGPDRGGSCPRRITGLEAILSMV
ncbi:HAD family hydrolase [Brachybacterium hainanense]|uniref:HAD family hydrolase n=1 Tax=Brachybacterium hainanense TaxID=1541174 RepID=A0ABV6R5V7_9MICO